MIQRFSISPFDLTVFAVLAICALAVTGLAWRAGGTMETADDLRFLYLTSDEQGRNHLFISGIAPDGTLIEPRALTDGSDGVWDFATAPGGKTVIYSALSSLGMGDLWALSLDTGQRSQLLACPEASCSNAQYAPDGRLLSYTLRNMSDYSSAFFSPPRLWILDTTTGETGFIFPDSQQLAFEGRWSPDGSRLSYISPDPAGLGVINLADGQTALYPNALGEAGVWHPQKNLLLTTNTWVEGQTMSPIFCKSMWRATR
ncbi:MAG: hypothetical protein R2873_25765 [Caldilineaceae bacterium]